VESTSSYKGLDALWVDWESMGCMKPQSRVWW